MRIFGSEKIIHNILSKFEKIAFYFRITNVENPKTEAPIFENVLSNFYYLVNF